MLFSLLLSILTQTQAPARDVYVLESADARRVQATLTITIQCENVNANEWVVFAAQAPALPGQVKVKSKMQPSAVVVNELSSHHRPILMARVPARTGDLAHGISVQITYEATLRSRRLRRLPEGEEAPTIPKLSDRERSAALADRGDIDFKAKAFKDWLESKGLHRVAGESEIDFALRVFREIQSSATYEYRPTMDRRASVVCKDGRSDCGGLSALFVAALRANGVPARILIGRWATSARPGQSIGGLAYYQAHAKAEFYASGVGWVPVDVSQAVRGGSRRASLRHFGNDDGDFIALQIDPNLEVDTIFFGRKLLHNLQGPAYWVKGQGSAARFKTAEDWRVEELRLVPESNQTHSSR
jgi:transglutaminase-like putative cysteine protease